MVIEIELKFELKNPEETTKILNNRANFLNENIEKDTYFTPSHKDFLKQTPVSEWLRIRETKNNATINYKKWHFINNKKSISCDEYETKIESLEELKKIFNSLDMIERIIVEKLRKNWKYKDSIISIDNVTDLGNFIEIEVKKNSKENIEIVKNNLLNMLNDLNIELGLQIFEGYPYLLLKKKNLI